MNRPSVVRMDLLRELFAQDIELERDRDGARTRVAAAELFAEIDAMRADVAALQHALDVVTAERNLARRLAILELGDPRGVLKDGTVRELLEEWRALEYAEVP